MFGRASFSSSASLHIAGVGASAGGLEAMLALFSRVQATGRLTYVVAQHMAKDGHDELVVRLMNRESVLPVVLAGNNEKLEADVVYVIPSGKDGIVKNGKLLLEEPRHLSTPSVNALFSSIAEAVQSHCVGIVLSGTGSDGSAGCRSIKSAGGLTIAQLPADAKFDGMPAAAISAKVIDEVLPVDAIGQRLVSRYPAMQNPPVKPLVKTVSSVLTTPLPQKTTVPPSSDYDQLLKLVHQATSIDFSSYKEDTLLRRIDKRMSTLGMGSLSDYLALARQQTDELKTLQHLFLVSVSSFFRDRQSFDVLKSSLSRVLSNKPDGEVFRVWVPGCASGEEALTLAILLRELTDKHPIEIVGTDLNPEALAIARAGNYRQTAFKEMDSDVRDRYFVAHGQHYQAKPELLTHIRYEQRDVLSGSPVQNLDLVSCRNLLIYMKSELQDELITRFHKSLHVHGLLFIGQSESLSFVGNSLFAPVDHFHRLFRRRS